MRADLLARHRSTNYSVVDIELIDELYRAEYAERVSGGRRLFMRRASSVDSVVDTTTGINVVVRDHISGATDTLERDALVLATGFEPAPLRPMLGELAPTQTAEQIVSRNYRLATPATVTAGIYLQGGTEKTHGITSSLLSNVAVRAGEILDSVVTGRGGEGCSVRVDPQYRNIPPGDSGNNVRRERNTMSTNPFDDEDGRFYVLANAEDQHSLWPIVTQIPAGWDVMFGEASRPACLAYVEKNWTDMRPRSLREMMGTVAAVPVPQR